MEVESVNCNNCGAPLQVTPATNFVTCKHCGASLAVKRSATSAYTEQLDRIDQRTERMADQLAQLTYQNELERIDREWEQERQQYMIADKHGHRHIPNPAMSLVVGVAAAGFGLVWTVMAASMGAPGFFPFFGVLFILFGIGSGLYSYGKAHAYQQAHARYQRRRSSVRPEDFNEGKSAD